MKDVPQNPRVYHLSKAPASSQVTRSTNMGEEGGVISSMDQAFF